jgi:hypothetical protein
MSLFIHKDCTMVQTADHSHAVESMLGMTLVRLNFLSAGAYKHLAAAASDLVEQRCFIRIAADRWRQWFELRKAFESNSHEDHHCELAKYDEREYSQILVQGAWTVGAVIEADLFLRDIYDEAAAATHDVALWSLLDRHRSQIDHQMRDVHDAHLESALSA